MICTKYTPVYSFHITKVLTEIIDQEVDNIVYLGINRIYVKVIVIRGVHINQGGGVDPELFLMGCQSNP